MAWVLGILVAKALLAAIVALGAGWSVRVAVLAGLLVAQVGEFSFVLSLHDHAVIVGFGLNGRNLAPVLAGTGIPYVALELNAETVRDASGEGQPIRYGDATRPEVLDSVGIGRARLLVACRWETTCW